jgi:hypothetical protein
MLDLPGTKEEKVYLVEKIFTTSNRRQIERKALLAFDVVKTTMNDRTDEKTNQGSKQKISENKFEFIYFIC